MELCLIHEHMSLAMSFNMSIKLTAHFSITFGCFSFAWDSFQMIYATKFNDSMATGLADKPSQYV